MRFDLSNTKARNRLAVNLRRCGYDVNETPRGIRTMEIEKDGELIGALDKNGDLLLMENYVRERESFHHIMDFTATFLAQPHAFMGHLELSSFDDTMMTVDLNPDTGKPVYYVYNVQSEMKTPEDMQPFAHANLEDAKLAYAEMAGLSSRDVYTRRQEHNVTANLIDHLQENGYKLRHTIDQGWAIYKGNAAVGNIDGNLQLTVTTPDTRIRSNMDSLRERARWEVQQSTDNDSVFTKKLADALIRLGYNIQHVWQRFQIQMAVFKGNEHVALVDNDNKIVFKTPANDNHRRDLETASKHARQEVQKDFEYSRQESQEKAQPVVAANPHPRADLDIEHEESEKPASPKKNAAAMDTSGLCFTTDEALFIKAIISSEACRSLAAKNGMEDITASIGQKLNDSFPQLPNYSNQHTAQQMSLENDGDEIDL